jgi:adenine-specific DNA methylase
VDKSVIEQQSLDLDRLIEEISQEGRKEKNANVPINDVFYWWTRKPLALSRASIVLSILNKIDDSRTFLKLNQEKRSFFYPIDTKKLQELVPNLNSIKILDPFAGSGNLIFESARLGCDCYASDYNPLSYVILKSTLEYPRRFSKTLVADIKKFGDELILNTKKDLDEFFDPQVLCYIWLWCAKCPHCGQKIPLTNNMWVSRKQNIGLKIIPENLDFKIELIQNISEKDASKFTQKGGRAICIKCNNSLDYQNITDSIKKDKERRLAFVKTESGFRLANKLDLESFEKAQNTLDESWNNFLDLNYIPQDEIKPDPRSGIRNYGILFWHQYFSKRQLLVFANIIKKIKKICKKIPDKEYQKVIATYLTLLLGKHLDANSLGVHWHTGTDGPEFTLSFRRTNFVFNHAEPNPFAKIRGNLYSILDDLVTGIEFCVKSNASAQIFFQSALDLTRFSNFDIILVDPPNPNDIQFAEQSEFFYVWMSKVLAEYYPEIPAKISIDEDISDSPGRFGDRKIALLFYEKGLKKSLSQINSVLKDDGLMLFYFSPSHSQAWNLLVSVLRDAKFQVTNLHSIHLENITNVMPQLGVESLGTILITCRKVIRKESVYHEDLPNLIENKIKDRLKNLSLHELILTPINDLFVISFGKILEIITQYSEIKSYQKEHPLDIDSIINETKKITIFYLLSRITTNSIGILGNQVAFYIFIKTFYEKILADELYTIVNYFGLNKKYIESKKMIVEENGFLRLARLDEFLIDEKPSEIASDNLYDQLLFIYQNINDIKSKKMNIKNYDNFKIDKILDGVKSLIQIKSILGQYDTEMQTLNVVLESL